VRDVADIIEEERSKVDGKTPINEEVHHSTHHMVLLPFTHQCSTT
jgi:hypothetical protein